MRPTVLEFPKQAGMIAPPRVAHRMLSLDTEGAFEILARAREIEAAGREVIHLAIGEPSFSTPPHIVEAAVAALQNGETRYGPPQGLPELRQAIADSLVTRGITRGPDDVVITPGAKPMVFYAILAIVNAGDEVLVPDPGFPIYPSVVRFAGGEPVSYGFGARHGFAIDVDEIEARITLSTRAIVLNSPHNPTGSVADRDTLERIAELALRHDLIVISDEIYSRLLFDDRSIAPSIAQVPEMADRTIIVDGFSKTWSMTGWRLGYGAMAPALAHRITTLAINSHTCTPAFTQRAGIAALTGPQGHTAFVRAELRVRRDLIVSGLRDLAKLYCVAPAGAFYAFVDVTSLGINDMDFVHRLLQGFGVASLAGSSFGDGGAGHLRLSFGTGFEQIAVALDRISRFCETVRGARTNGRGGRPGV